MTKNQIISYLILLFWLATRISQSTLVLGHDDILASTSTSDRLSNWIVVLYGLILFGSFTVIIVVIQLNRDDLQRLNIDVLYIILLLIAGIIGLYVLPYNCFSGIAFLSLVGAWLSKKIKFGIPNPHALRIAFWTVGIFAGVFWVISSILLKSNTKPDIYAFVVESFPQSIFEEAFYRGLLFMFLKDLRFGQSKIFYIQAFIFWISHVNYFFQSPFTFWIFIPAVGLTLGYITLRTKSIGLSAIAHILMNLLSEYL